MEKKGSVQETLRALAAGATARSETAQLADIFDDIEAALSAGVSRAAVLEALHSHGFTISMKGFETALYRLRKKRQTTPGNMASPPAAGGASSQAGVGSKPRIGNPAELRKARQREFDLDDLSDKE